MNTFKNGIKLSGSLIVAAIMSIFLCISINVICSAVFTVETGYKAYVYETKESSKIIDEYEYKYTDEDANGKDDGTDTKRKEYEDAGNYVAIVKLRSTLEGTGKVVFLALTQILASIMVIAFASNAPYKQGFKDYNMVKIGHMNNDILKGFKIGLIGNIPFFALALVLIIMACGMAPAFKTVWYAFLNGHFYSLIILISNGAQTVSEMGAFQLILLALIQFIAPVISGVAYIFGFKGINLAEKIVYKKEVK